MIIQYCILHKYNDKYYYSFKKYDIIMFVKINLIINNNIRILKRIIKYIKVYFRRTYIMKK